MKEYELLFFFSRENVKCKKEETEATQRKCMIPMCTLVQGHILLSRRFAKQFERQVNVRENAHNLYILVPAIRLSFGAVPCSRRP